MSKRFLLLTVVLVIAGLVTPSALTAQAEDEAVVRAVLFYSPTCPHCHEVITELLVPMLEEYGEQLQIAGIDTSQPGGAQLYAAVIGLSGGIITVVFFAAWGHLFGRSHLGRVQGAAQFATVLASAVGPVVVAEGREWTGSYGPTFYVLAAVVAALAVAATLAPLPRREAERPAKSPF